MKALLMSVLAFVLIASSAMASDRDYKCIADRLQAMNSDVYYNLSESDIYSMITIPEMFGHIDAINAEKACNNTEEKKYQCVADGLQAYNSDIYYNLSKTEIDAMISIPEMFGHIDAVRVARRCGLL